eukprot:scaffold2157_cov111-Cylindrotheca_fusiformis.AAC.6
MTCNMATTNSSLSGLMLQRPQPSPSLSSDCIEAPISGNVKSTTPAETCPFNVMSEKRNADKYLARAMNILSSEDRETALEEVNGIVSTIPEDPTSLDQCLQEMNRHLMSLKQGTYYEVAEKMNSDFVTDRDFRTMFLRANRFASNGKQQYDPKRAAAQMKIFFDTKFMLFGKDKLVKDITLSDLDDGARCCLQGGSLQVLPVRDRAGRLVVVSFSGEGRNFKSVESELRARFYLFMSLKNSKEAQEKGLVMIYYSVGQYGDENSDSNTISLVAKCMTSFPYHWAGMHVCCDDYRQYIALSEAFCSMPASVAARVRVQFGNHMECLHALRGHGIQEGSVPISPTNAQMILKNHTQWYQQQCMREKIQSRNEGIINCNGKMEQVTLAVPPTACFAFSLQTLRWDAPILPSPFLQNRNHSICGFQTQRTARPAILPRPFDVLFGHDFKLHAGNFRLRDILAHHAAEYEAAGGRPGKIQFTAQLVQKIKATGTRFLALNKATMEWVEVADSKARVKLAKSIRNRRRNAKEPVNRTCLKPET